MKRLLGLLIVLCLQNPALAETSSTETFPARSPTKIIALAPHIVESLYAIGAGEHIIATVDHADYPKEAKAIPRIGNYARIQIERVLQLKPDVIIAWKTGNPAEDLARLENYGLKVIYSHPTKLEGVADELLMLGKLTGKEDKAQQLASDYKARLQALRAKYQDAPKVIGFYEMWAKPLRTIANKAWLQQQLEVCGVNNPFVSLSEDYPLVNLEKVLTSMPEIVIQPNPFGDGNPDSLNWKKWPHIPASKNDFVFHPNADKSHRMTTRMLDELENLCTQVEKARVHYQVQR